MSACGTIPHRLGLAIGLVPNDVGTQIPAVRLKSEGNLPRDTDKVFRFQARWRWRAIIHSSCRVLLVALPPRAATTCIGVANIQPERPIVPKDAANLAEDLSEVVEV